MFSVHEMKLRNRAFSKVAPIIIPSSNFSDMDFSNHLDIFFLSSSRGTMDHIRNIRDTYSLIGI